MPQVLVIGPDQNGRTLLCVDGVIAEPSSVIPSDAAHLPCHGTVLEPGRVNAHTHLYSGLAPLDMPMPSEPPATFVGILEEVWWKLDRALDPDTLRASARFYIANALLSVRPPSWIITNPRTSLKAHWTSSRARSPSWAPEGC